MIYVSFRSSEEEVVMDSWPVELQCRPMVGDRVRSISGLHTRKIASITHVGGDPDGKYGAHLEIELTVRL